MSIKTILVANNHLNSVGGSETFTYAMIESLISKGPKRGLLFSRNALLCFQPTMMIPRHFGDVAET